MDPSPVDPAAEQLRGRIAAPHVRSLSVHRGHTRREHPGSGIRGQRHREFGRSGSTPGTVPVAKPDRTRWRAGGARSRPTRVLRPGTPRRRRDSARRAGCDYRLPGNGAARPVRELTGAAAARGLYRCGAGTRPPWSEWHRRTTGIGRTAQPPGCREDCPDQPGRMGMRNTQGPSHCGVRGWHGVLGVRGVLRTLSRR